MQGSCEIRVVEDGAALVANRVREESDIWMLTLGTVAAAPPASHQSLTP
ncbi:MAG: hypothetical protein ACYTHJ_11430 [Planctomycetota bacterium]|jgi:hypothetical protein